MTYDAHNLSVACRGVDCKFDSRHYVCADWSEEVVKCCYKHRKSFISKSRKSLFNICCNEDKYVLFNEPFTPGRTSSQPLSTK